MSEICKADNSTKVLIVKDINLATFAKNPAMLHYVSAFTQGGAWNSICRCSTPDKGTEAEITSDRPACVYEFLFADVLISKADK